MKKILAMAIGAAVVASFASAQTYSKNAVGFINIPAEANHLYALTLPFDNMAQDSNGEWKFEDTQLAQDAPDGSTVYFWDGTGWTPFNKGRDGFGIDDDRFVNLQPGQCFFFEPSEEMTIVMTGEVPSSSSTIVPVTGAENLTAIGNPYPTPLKFEDTQLAQDASDGSTVYFWDGTGWTPFNKGRDGFGIDDERFVTLEPGHGFFFQTTDEDDSSSWSVEKEYTWP